MHFRLSYYSRGFQIYHGEAMETQCGENREVLVTIRAEKDRKDELSGEAVCVAMQEVSLSEEIEAMFQELAKGKLPTGYRLSMENWKNDAYIDEDGRIKTGTTPPWHMLPAPMEAEIHRTYEHLFSYIQQVVSLFRWRYGISGGVHSLMWRYLLDWSFDGEHWNHLIAPIFMDRIGSSSHHRLYGEISEFVQQQADLGAIAPLHWDLWREARDQVQSNPRSAVLLMIAAAEIGFKHCVTLLVPDAAYLVENVQTLPLPDLLKNYLPKLPVKNRIDDKVLPPPSRIRSAIDTGVKNRNILAHRPIGARSLASELTKDYIETLLDTIEDLLRLYDYYCGAEWAYHFISEPTKEELKQMARSAN